MVTKTTICLLFTLLASASLSLNTIDLKETRTKFNVDEALYLPNGNALQTIAMGFNNVLSDILWFNTISYFGKHFRTDQSYPLLSHMCNVVVDLNPKAQHVYRFCAIMIAWELNQAQQSNAILTKAIDEFPDNWFFLYLRGFNYLYFLNDTARAHEDLTVAASKPNVHPMVKDLASKQSSELEDPALAIRTIQGLIRGAPDPSMKYALEKRLQVLLDQQKGRTD